jgi:hypothetical protein
VKLIEHFKTEVSIRGSSFFQDENLVRQLRLYVGIWGRELSLRTWIQSFSSPQPDISEWCQIILNSKPAILNTPLLSSNPPPSKTRSILVESLHFKQSKRLTAFAKPAPVLLLLTVLHSILLLPLLVNSICTNSNLNITPGPRTTFPRALHPPPSPKLLSRS